MKLLLVKIGKAWNILKRDGLFRGGARVLGAFCHLFQSVPPGDILFISNGVGDSARYRTQHVAEELRLQGFRVSVTIQDNPFLVSYAEKFSIFILHRTVATSKVKTLVEQIKQFKKEIIFEADDLVYDSQFLSLMDGYGQMNSLERKLYENGVGGEILADPYVTTCTTTTTFLANKLREHDKRVLVVPNKLSQNDVAVAEKIVKGQSLIPHPFVRIGYFSGTMSHNKDFATITEALVELLDKYPQLELCLVGPLETASALKCFENRIVTLPYAAREQHFANIASVDINVAPLEIGNPFCESKSELKFFEAGIVGVPTVASATGPYREAIADGGDGFVASTTAEWTEKLERLILDENLRKNMGAKARETALRNYTTSNAHNKEYYEYLKSKIAITV